MGLSADRVTQWEVIAAEQEVVYRYPPDDLIPLLVDNYFTTANCFTPILHCPLFERALSN